MDHLLGIIGEIGNIAFHDHDNECCLIKEKGMVITMNNKEMLCVKHCNRLLHDKSRAILITLCNKHSPHFTDEKTERRDFPTFPKVYR